MNSNIDQPSSKIDWLKWLIVLALFSAGIVVNYYYSDIALPLRIIGWFLLVGIMMGVAALTEKGRQILSFSKEARTELRKVVWPTRQETIQKTILVVIAVLIMGLVLWGIDSILLWLVSLLTGQRG